MSESNVDGGGCGSTHLPGTVGALNPELVYPTGRILADDRLKVVVGVLGLHRRHRVRQPLGSRELQGISVSIRDAGEQNTHTYRWVLSGGRRGHRTRRGRFWR